MRGTRRRASVAEGGAHGERVEDESEGSGDIPKSPEDGSKETDSIGKIIRMAYLVHILS